MKDHLKTLKAQFDGKPSTVNLFGEVGYDFTAAGVMEQLKGITGSVDVNLYSGGGSLFEGAAIYSILNRRAAAGDDVNMYVHGLAASAGSFIMMSGTKVIIDISAMVMVHNAWTVAAGNSKDLREQADIMELQQQSMVDAYVRRTGKSKEEIQSMLDAETWMTAETAVAEGFADETFEVPAAMKVAASIDRKIADRYAMAKIPESVKVTDTQTPPTQTTQIMNEAILKACGLSTGATDSDVLAFITTLKAEKGTIQSQLTDAQADVTSKTELIGALQTENADLQSQVDTLTEKTTEEQITAEVNAITDEIDGDVPDEVTQGLRRRAQRIIGEDDEDVLADLRSDMKLYAQANAVKTGTQVPNSSVPNPSGSHKMNTNAPKSAAGGYEAKLKAKVDAIIANDPSTDYQSAITQAKAALQQAEINSTEQSH